MPVTVWTSVCDMDFTIGNWTGAVPGKQMTEYPIMMANARKASDYQWTVFTYPRKFQDDVFPLNGELIFNFFKIQDFTKSNQTYRIDIIASTKECEISKMLPFSLHPYSPEITSSDKIFISTITKGIFHTMIVEPATTKVSEEYGWAILSSPDSLIPVTIDRTGHLLATKPLVYSATPYPVSIGMQSVDLFYVTQDISIYVRQAHSQLEQPIAAIEFWTDTNITVEERQTEIVLQINTIFVNLDIIHCDDHLELVEVNYVTLVFKPFKFGFDGSISVKATFDDQSQQLHTTKTFQVHVKNIVDTPIWEEETIRLTFNETIPAVTEISILRAESPDNLTISYYLTVYPIAYYMTFHLDKSTGRLKNVRDVLPGNYTLTVTAETFPAFANVVVVLNVLAPTTVSIVASSTITTTATSTAYPNILTVTTPSDASSTAIDDSSVASPSIDTITSPSIPEPSIVVATTSAAATPSANTNADLGPANPLHLLWLLPLIPVCAGMIYLCFLHIKYSIPIPTNLRELKTLYIDFCWGKHMIDPKASRHVKQLWLYCDHDWIQIQLNSHSTADSDDDGSLNSHSTADSDDDEDDCVLAGVSDSSNASLG